MNAVETAPIVKTLEINKSAGRAFQIFTEEIGAWWPVSTHSRARQDQGDRTEAVTIEPRVGGRIFETLQDGRELDWGEVLAWEPGALVEFSWQLGHPAERSTQVAVRFEPIGDQACRLTLTHSGWERLGSDGAGRRESYHSGWEEVFGRCFGGYAGTH
jgi:uncharacterized protein YndB with AHSA1/START domain